MTSLTPCPLLSPLTRGGFSGERQGGGVEGLPSIRERSFEPSTMLESTEIMVMP
jgi:hypothetical protein